MATLKQKALAKAIINNAEEGTKKTATELLVSSGYSVKSAEQSSKFLIEQEGVQNELKKAGFTLEEADNVVGFILKNGKTERNQLEAADKIYKRLGGYAPEKHINVDVSLSDMLKQLKKDRENES